MVIRVVVVDDHDLVRRCITQQLEDTAGVEVVGCGADGHEAVALVREHGPDVVLMDLSMPRMNGIDATRAILADRPGTRVVALTSFADGARVREALEAGVVGYHLKDFEPGALLTALRAAAGGTVMLDSRVARWARPAGTPTARDR